MADRRGDVNPHVAVDGHVLTGRPQGIQTTLSRILKAIADLGFERQFEVYVDDENALEKCVGATRFSTRMFRASSALIRLVFVFPILWIKKPARYYIWQYISSPFIIARHIVFIHDVLPFTHGRYFSFWFRWRCRVLFSLSMLMAWKIICVSEYSARQVVKLYPWLSKRICVVLNGPSFEVDTYFERAVVADEPYILVVGRMEARKNIALVAEAFQRAALEGVRLVVVGRPEPGFDVPVGENIDVMQNVDDFGLINLYRRASLFVMASSAEGFGLPLLDAMLFGIPSISSNTTALPEIGGQSVTYFDPDCAEAKSDLRDLLVRHFTEQALPSPSMEARISLSQRFSWKAAGATLCDLVA